MTISFSQKEKLLPKTEIKNTRVLDNPGPQLVQMIFRFQYFFSPLFVCLFVCLFICLLLSCFVFFFLMELLLLLVRVSPTAFTSNVF